jgi:hypothetical protein
MMISKTVAVFVIRWSCHYWHSQKPYFYGQKAIIYKLDPADRQQNAMAGFCYLQFMCHSCREYRTSKQRMLTFCPLQPTLFPKESPPWGFCSANCLFSRIYVIRLPQGLLSRFIDGGSEIWERLLSLRSFQKPSKCNLQLAGSQTSLCVFLLMLFFFALRHGERDADLDQCCNINWKSYYETRMIRFRTRKLMSSRKWQSTLQANNTYLNCDREKYTI